MTHVLDDKQAKRITATVDMCTQDADGNPVRVDVTFQGLGRRRFNELRDKHMATDDQVKENRKRQLDAGVQLWKIADIPWNPDTFPQALIAASAIDPPITPAQAKKIWASDDWSDTELDNLFSAALLANQHDGVSLGKELDAILASVRS